MVDEFTCEGVASQHNLPILIVLSGPSGVGKDAVLSRMRELGYPLFYTVTMTTRDRRPAERHGVDYYFVPLELFEILIDKAEFLEWANVYGNYYGVPRSLVKEALQSGKDVIIKADVQGARTIKAAVPDAITVFLAPPSLDDLADRLRQRKTETLKDLTIRLETAREEMKCLPTFDYVVLNASDRLDEAAEHICSVIEAEKCKVVRRRVKL
ncbi:MAG: guanylate kinase [Chloroflexi bacterium]|nr:guanylate kinase [Chloroflexota bacterium]